MNWNSSCHSTFGNELRPTIVGTVVIAALAELENDGISLLLNYVWTHRTILQYVLVDSLVHIRRSVPIFHLKIYTDSKTFQERKEMFCICIGVLESPHGSPTNYSRPSREL